MFQITTRCEFEVLLSFFSYTQRCKTVACFWARCRCSWTLFPRSVPRLQASLRRATVSITRRFQVVSSTHGQQKKQCRRCVPRRRKSETSHEGWRRNGCRVGSGRTQLAVLIHECRRPSPSTHNSGPDFHQLGPMQIQDRLHQPTHTCGSPPW